MSSLQRKILLATGLLFCGAVAFSMAATQYVAWRFAWHPALGSPWIGQIHAPWRWLDWQARFGATAPDIFETLHAGMGLAGMLISAGLLAFANASHRKPKRHEGIHGTAHWAGPDEVEAAGLLNETGVHVGGWRDRRGRLRILRHDGPEHVAAIAPTRSGKGVGLVVPTLLTWPHSLVVNDQKGELWNLTAGWRARAAGNQVLRFDPGAAEGSTRFNPLDEIRLGTIHEVGDVQNLVTILVDPEGKGLIDHWAKTSHAFLTGVSTAE